MQTYLPAEDDSSKPKSFRAVIFASDEKTTEIVTIRAGSDEEASAKAAALAIGLSVDLWDDLRFIDRFPDQLANDTCVPAVTGAASNS